MAARRTGETESRHGRHKTDCVWVTGDNLKAQLQEVLDAREDKE